ncbi:hypothetical protein WAZ07_18705 [Bacillus sp. FJAT-51639]|uniref:Hydrolase n=1 Tax=Bacillus bruguierae TaxID=3127667 RepID=A0ABU8FKS2_9BACI
MAAHRNGPAFSYHMQDFKQKEKAGVGHAVFCIAATYILKNNIDIKVDN